MSTPKAIAYDLGIALGAVGLWLVPVDGVRAIGYATSVVFSARGYYTGITLLAEERRRDEIEAMTYDVDVEFQEKLLESSFELKLQQLENRFLEYLIPLTSKKTELEQQLARAVAEHVESESESVEDSKESEPEAKTEGISEDVLREEFPETSDSSNWKAVLKALQGGATSEEIIKDVLCCRSDVGEAYLKLLKQKFF